MAEGYSNPISPQTTSQSSVHPNMGDETAGVETNQLSNERGLDNMKMRYLARASISIDCNAIKKLTDKWDVNPSNLSSFMKLDSIENIPKVKKKSQSVRERKSSNKTQSARKLSRGITQSGWY